MKKFVRKPMITSDVVANSLQCGMSADELKDFLKTFGIEPTKVEREQMILTRKYLHTTPKFT